MATMGMNSVAVSFKKKLMSLVGLVLVSINGGSKGTCKQISGNKQNDND
jgi:hypothetical protein